MYELVGEGAATAADLVGVFDQIADTDHARRRASAHLAALIAEACDRWHVDQDMMHAACERLIEGGADGTTMIGEFLALELGPILRVSPTTAAFRIADVLNLRDRHPQLWAAVQQLHVEMWQATEITRACRELSAEAAEWVDRQVATALKTMPWSRVSRAVPDLIVKADPALAAEKAAAERDRRLVRIGQYRDGGGTVYGRLSAADAYQLDETISALANRLATPDNPTTVDHRRATALGLLAEPDRAATILAGGEAPTSRQATLFVHLPAGSIVSDDPGTIATIEGVGALTRQALLEFTAAANIRIRPVIDHNSIPPVDSYRVPPNMREAITTIWPVEAFPWASRRSRGCDQDHSESYDHSAPVGAHQTHPGNLSPQSRRQHRAKTIGDWACDQTQPGTLEWQSRLGYRYRVTPQGTQNLGRHPNRTAARPPGTGPPRSDLPRSDPAKSEPPGTEPQATGPPIRPDIRPDITWADARPRIKVTYAA